MFEGTKRLAVALTAVWCLWAGIAAAQEDTEEAEASFFDIVNVHVVNVDVYVTDRKGEPVRGLTKDDFEILEDGRKVQVTNFYTEEMGLEASRQKAADLPVPERIRGSSADVPEEQRLSLVVYVDNLNLRPFNRNRVFARLREFLKDNVERQDRVMLISYERSLKYRVPFTTDPSAINAELIDMEDESALGVQDDSDRRDILRAIEEADTISEAEGRIRTYAEQKHNDLSFTVSALGDFVDTLAGLPGRKAIIYLSDGLPMVPGEDLYQALMERFRDSAGLLQVRELDLSRQFSSLAARANTNRVTFYTIDAGGLRAPGASSVQEMTGVQSGYVDSLYIQNIQSPLRMMAEETGGTAIVNTNDVAPALAKMANDFRFFYSLGYTPAHAGDGRYHRIKVRLKDKEKGRQVRHREGYRDRSINARTADTTQAALVYGFEQNSQGLVLRFGEGQRREDGNFEVPVLLAIPLDNVVLVPRGENHEGKLRLFVAAMDSEGGDAPPQEMPLQIRIPSSQMDSVRGQNKAWTYRTKLLMRAGDQRVAVAVRDELGGESSVISRSVRVGGSS